MNESSHSFNTHQREKVWSDIHDAMLLRAPHRFKLHIRAKIKKTWLVTKSRKHSSILAYLLTWQRSYHPWHHIGDVLDWRFTRQHRLQWFLYFQHHCWYLEHNSLVLQDINESYLKEFHLKQDLVNQFIRRARFSQETQINLMSCWINEPFISNDIYLFKLKNYLDSFK